MTDRVRSLRSDLLAARLAPEELTPFLTLLEEGTEVFDRHHYLPGHITGSGIVAHPFERTVALVHHDALDLWVQPGGHVEAEDEDVAACARREVTEEIGLDDLASLGLLDVDVHVFPERGDRPQHLHFDVRYAFSARVDRLVAGDGVRQVRWVAVDAALALDESVARPVRRMAALLGW